MFLPASTVFNSLGCYLLVTTLRDHVCNTESRMKATNFGLVDRNIIQPQPGCNVKLLEMVPKNRPPQQLPNQPVPSLSLSLESWYIGLSTLYTPYITIATLCLGTFTSRFGGVCRHSRLHLHPRISTFSEYGLSMSMDYL